MSILVGTTLAAYVMDQPDTWAAWLRNAEALRASVPDERVEFFAAIETDGRGLTPFAPLTARLDTLAAADGRADPAEDRTTRAWWSWSLDDGRTEVTKANRLRHITIGQNIVTDRAVSDPECTHLLFMAADTMAEDNVLAELLAMHTLYVGPRIPTYCLTGPPGLADVPDPDGPRRVPVEFVMPSAACVLIARRVFNVLRWRHDPVAGLSDDPAYARDVARLLGGIPMTRTDLRARHFPEQVPDIAERGHDMRVVR